MQNNAIIFLKTFKMATEFNIYSIKSAYNPTEVMAIWITIAKFPHVSIITNISGQMLDKQGF